MTSGFTLFGTPGLVDMPSALSRPDGEIASTLAYFPGTTRGTLTFQITPRLSGSFRYSRIERPAFDDTLYDRSFDLQYRLLDQGRYMPAVAVGLRDFLGTGVYSGEYVVATRQVTPDLRITGGIGWGRLGSYNGFDNPLGALDERFETRPGGFSGRGGQFEIDQLFRGDAAFFGGVEYQLTDRVGLVAEYSSDAYATESAPGGDFEHRSPFNFGVNYRMGDNLTLAGYYLHGSQVGVQATIALNPSQPPHDGALGEAPVPVQPRPARATGDGWNTGWTEQSDAPDILADNLAGRLEDEGVELAGLEVSATAVRVRFRNNERDAEPQALGRIARALSRTMPASVETFILVPERNGVALPSTTLQRSDIEALEFAPGGAEAIRRRADFGDAGRLSFQGRAADVAQTPRFSWSIDPYTTFGLFDPDAPVRGEIGVEAEASYRLARGLYVSGAVRKRVVGNLDDIERESNSVLPHVRSDHALYAEQGDPSLSRLLVEHFARPGENLYSRLSVGYLERMFAGASGELLWAPSDSRLALGVEINHVWQRDFDLGFGVQDYDVTTGHASAYYDFGNGFHGQIDTGRYLAGDWGATIALDREFANGWRVGAFATFTDVSAEEFGEGSFDKGLRFTVPLSWFTGEPTRSSRSATIRPLTRDGGARLSVPNRLYETVRDYRAGDLERSWGTFWQ
ncbi:YjbH domain-containing protein [Rhodobacteraceae bacterium WD3A24]|nr:YjbH domain-containing protein [Rhodobacteraceae bacterium WD3A24]